jgi:transcriptional regulator with XRE-family HTH domain
MRKAAETEMTPSQCRGARGLLGWSQDDLAEASGVSDVTVRNFETEQVTPRQASLREMRTAFESVGVIFVDEDGQGPGVKMKLSNLPALCRTARGLLGWKQSDLAGASRVSDVTISKFESERLTPRKANLRKIRRAFENAGVIFIDEGDEGAGARLRKGLR